MHVSVRHGRRFVLTASIGAALFALSPTSAEQPAKIEAVIVETETGSTLFMAEIADTPELRQRGLMFRHRLPPDSAMLFDFIDPRPVSMWMKNTYVSLDMVFIRPDGTIAAIAENTVPRSETPVGTEEPVRGVLEVVAGTARRLGLEPGDVVRHRIFGNLR
jgi:uncharacterized protein